MLRLNLGCGENLIEGAINIDCVTGGNVKPDLVLNFLTTPLPYKDGEADEVWMIHCLEHVELFHWERLFREVRRVLRDNGTFTLAYPEFKECAQRFIDNTGNQKNFWRNTLYGRQLYDTDYHVVPMDSLTVKEMLENVGFYRVTFRAESTDEPYNTILCGYKDPSPTSREAVIVEELHLVR